MTLRNSTEVKEYLVMMKQELEGDGSMGRDTEEVC